MKIQTTLLMNEQEKKKLSEGTEPKLKDIEITDFSVFVFESPKPFITINEEEEKGFVEYTKKMRIFRKVKGEKTKKSKLVYIVEKEYFFSNDLEQIVEVECKTPQEAINFFEWEKELTLGCIKNRVIFDGRYFWTYKIQNNKLIFKEKNWSIER